MKPIFLIGYMGSGKSTLGRALTSRTGVRFIDLDDYIEEREQASVSEIFAGRGEAGFRAAERAALEEVASLTDVIVACGGGTPCQPGAMELMNSAGSTVFLSASLPRLFVRLKEGRAKRPLIAKLSDSELEHFVADSLARRMPFYSAASAAFCSDRLESEEEIASTCTLFVNRFMENC